MPSWKKIVTSGSNASLNSLYVSNSVTASVFSGSLIGTASYAITASYALNGSGGTSNIYVADEGTTQGDASYFNFIGNGVSATVSAGTASINITGGSLIVSGANAILNQTAASTTWSFNHELGTRYPVFTIFDENNDVIIPEKINAANTSSAVIYFSSARTGKAVATVGGNATASLSTSASYAISSSYSFNATSASYANNATSANTASYVLNAVSASYASNADLLDNRDSTTFANTGSNIFIGTQTITGSIIQSGSLIQIGDSILTGSLIISGSTIQSGNNTLIGNTMLSGSIKVSGSQDFLGTQTLTGSFLVSGSTTQVGNNTLLGNTLISGSITISGSYPVGSYSSSVNIYGDTSMTGYLKFNPQPTNINSSLSASYIYVSGSTNDLYFTQNGNGYNNTTRLRWLEGNLYTGLLNGGLISATTGSTTFNLSSGSGIVVSLNASLNDNPYPTIKYVNWGNFTSQPLTYLTSSIQTYIGVDNNGQITQQNTAFNDGTYNEIITIGTVLHQNLSTINASITYPNVAYGYKQRSYDFLKAFGPLKLSGLNIVPSSSFGLEVSSGTAFADGRNYQIDPNNPSYITDSGTAVSKIFRYYQSGSQFVQDTNGGVGYTSIDPNNYNPGGLGILTPVPGTGANRQWSIQRVFWYPNSATKGIVVYYGNTSYATSTDAVANISYEQFLEVENTKQNAVYLGALVLRNNADFTDSTSYNILPGGLFRNVGGSGGGGTVVTTLLSQLGDVSITSPTDSQPLVYDDTLSKWINQSFISASISGNASTSTSSSYASSSTSALYAINTTSASYAYNASLADSSINANTASYAILAANAINSLTATTATTAVSASYATSATSASYALNATTSSYSLTSAPSYVDNFITVGMLGSNTNFTSIKSAVDSITDATQYNTYTVKVYPGVYVEDTITMKSWVAVKGDSSISTVVSGSSPSQSIFVMADQSMIIDMQIQGSTFTGSSAVYYSSPTTPQTNAIAYVENVRFGTNYTNATCAGSGSGNCILQCSNVKYGGFTEGTKSFDIGFRVSGSGGSIGRMQLRNVTSTNGGVAGSDANQIFALADAPGCTFIVNGCLLTRATGAATGTGFKVYNGGQLRLTAVNFQRWINGIWAPQTGSAPSIDAVALNFENCTYDVLIEHTGSIGKVSGTDNFLKTIIPATASLYEVNQDPRKLTVSKKGGDFTSISASVAWITDSSINNRYVIDVGPGQFTEKTIDLTGKPYVSIVGSNIQTTQIFPSSSAQHIIKLGINNEVSFLSLANAGSGYAGLYVDDIGDFGQAHKLSFYNCDTNVYVTSRTQDTQFFGEYLDFNGTYSYGTIVSASNGFAALANLENYYLFPSGSGTTVIGNLVEGPGSEINLYGASFIGEYESGSTAIKLSDGAILESSGADIQGWGYALNIPNVGSAPTFRMVGSMIHNSVEYDIYNTNSTTKGRFQGISDHSKINNNSTDLYWNFLDDTDGENDVTRKLSVTFADGTHTDATTLIFKGSPMGVMSGGEITISGSLTVTTAAGFGYLEDSITPDVYKRIDWINSNITLSPNTNNYLYINDNSILSAGGSEPSIITNIILGRVVTNNSGVELIDQSEYAAAHMSNKISKFNRDALGPVYSNGSIVTTGITPFTLDVTAGSYFFSENNFLPAGTASVNMVQYYPSASEWNRSISSSLVPHNVYVSGSSLIPMSSSYYTKHSVYLVGDGVNEKYFLVLNNNQYSTLVEAEGATLPSIPSYFNDGVVSLANIYVQSGSAAITEIEDIRPIIGFRAAGVNASSVHGNLLGLSADDHTQYLLVDGARQMSGNLGLGGNNIYNFGSISGSGVSINSITASIANITSITGSLLGNSSTSTSASYAFDATSASYAFNATTSSYSLNVLSSSYAFNATSASYVFNATSASYAVTSSYALNSSAGGYTVSTKITNYTETATSGIIILLADTTSGTFTITLPTAVGNTSTISIKKIATANTVIVDGNGSQTIDGGLTATLNKIYESITLISDNTNWFII